MVLRPFSVMLFAVLTSVVALEAEPKAWICSADPSGAVAPSVPCLRVKGRAVIAPNDGTLGTPGLLLFDWPGTVLEARFTGTSLALMLASPDLYLEVCVDQNCRIIRVEGEMKRYPITSGLKKGEHRLRVAKRSETIGTVAAVGGVILDKGEALLPAPPPAVRQVEFIGDSYTAGYGVESPSKADPSRQDETGRECDDPLLRRTTNTQRAQGVVAARWLGADYQINAFSGLGMVRAYNGSPDFLPFPEYYDRALMNRPHPLYNPAFPPVGQPWKPQAVVIALGTNDFSTSLQPHEGDRFPNREALTRSYLEAYALFLNKLRTRYPGARFFLVSTNLGSGDELTEAITALVNSERKAGRNDLEQVHLPATTMYGCHWHPDLNDQARSGKALAEAIGKRMGWELKTP